MRCLWSSVFCWRDQLLTASLTFKMFYMHKTQTTGGKGGKKHISSPFMLNIAKKLSCRFTVNLQGRLSLCIVQY